MAAPKPISPLYAFLLAGGVVLAATLVTLLTPNARTQPFYSFYMTACVVAAWYGGRLGGLLALGGSVFTIGAFFAPGLVQRIGNEPAYAIRLLFTLGFVLLVIELLERSRTNQQRLQAVVERTERQSSERLHLVESEREARSQAELAEERFRTLVDTLDAIVWEADAKTLQFTYVSKRAEEILGYPVDAWLQDSSFWEKTIHPDDRERAVSTCRATSAKGLAHDFEYRAITAAGEVRWLHDYVMVSCAQDGTPQLLRGVMVDVTSRKQVEEELRAYRDRLNVAQEVATLGAWEWNVKTGGLWWSEGVSRIHGHQPESLPPSMDNWMHQVVPEHRQLIYDTINEALRTGNDYLVEYKSIWPDGSEHWLEARGKVFFDSDGKPERMAGIGIDVTQRKQTEEALRRSEKLAALGRLAASVAHEINNPLEAIVNLVFLAKTNPEKAAGFLASAEQELARITELSKQTLRFYRDTSVPVRLRLDSVAEELLRLYAPKLDRKRISIRTELQPVEVVAFPGEIRQLLLNLLSNAVDAVDESGRITLKVRALPSGERAQILIADDGQGIPAEQRHRLFEAFFTTKLDVGTGLGLWISNSIAQKHGGTIRLRSSTGSKRRGTTLVVTLPLAANEKVIAESTASAS